MFQRIAVALDETEQSQRALRAAVTLAKRLDSGLMTITVKQPLPAYTAFVSATDSAAFRTLEEDHSKFYEELLSSAFASAIHEGAKMENFLIDGDAVDGIVSFVAEHQIDLLVIGLHRRSLRVYSIWSTVYALAQDLSCNMLGVH